MQQEYPIPDAYRNRKYLQDIETDSPVLRAAADVAIAGHEGQSRGKADADLPYIVHPIMVYNLLRAMGETDEIMLAGALLHDVKEDNKAFREDHGAFERALVGALKERDVTDAEPIAQEIGKLCAELTNPEKMEEGKRLYQVKHAGHLSLRAAKIKLLDQTASVLDFIMQENEPGFTHDQVASWNFKALNLVKKIAQERPQLGMWRNLHKALFSYAMRIVNSSSPEEAETLRQEFNWDTAIQAAIDMPESKDAAIEETVQRACMEGVDAGIVSVMLGKDGNVIGYAALAAPEETRDMPRNTVAVAMMDALECPESTRRITPGEPTQENDRLVRHYKVKPPMDVPSFITAAMANQAMDNAFATTLRDKARTIASGRSPY